MIRGVATSLSSINIFYLKIKRMKNSKYMNAVQTALYLTISKTSLYRLAAQKQIPYYQLGSRKLFNSEEIDTWLKGRKEETNNIDFNNLKGFLNWWQHLT